MTTNIHSLLFLPFGELLFLSKNFEGIFSQNSVNDCMNVHGISIRTKCKQLRKIRYLKKIVETICQKFIFRGVISWQSAETEWSPLQFCRGRLFNEKTTTNGISNVKFQKLRIRIWNIFDFETLFRALF